MSDVLPGDARYHEAMVLWVLALAAMATLTAAALKLWAGVTLMTSYRVEEYLATPRARRLYWTVMLAPLVIGCSIVAMSFCSDIWWIELPAAVLCASILCSIGWKVWMRFSGRYVEYHRERQWR